MGKLLFNGRALSATLDWDKETHPFAWIGQNAAASTKTWGLYMYVSAEQPTVVYNENVGGETMSAATVLMVPYNEETEAWEFVSGDTWLGPQYNTASYLPVWANFDVMRADGTLFLAASEPIEANPLDRPEFKWGIAVGMSIKGRSGSKDGSTYVIVGEDGTPYVATEVAETITFTATPSDVLRGKVAASAEGVIVGTYTPALQEITVTPTAEEQYFTPGEGYDGIGTVTVEGLEIVVSDEDTRKAILSRSFEAFKFPDDATKVGAGAFYGCDNLALTSMPDTVSIIGDYAFCNCLDLTATALPEALTSIGIGAFYGCASLTINALPENVVNIGDYAFDGCTHIAFTELPDGLFGIGHYTFAECELLALTALPAGVTTIGNYAFSCCPNLALTALPDSLESIGVGAFEGCTGLAISAIPAAVKTVGNYAFANCTGLSAITFKGTPGSIAENAFANCDNLVKINVPWAAGEVANAPWGASGATITYDYTAEG